MAQRRMFSLAVIDTDKFNDMPISARLLYYELGMRADDDGFVSSPKKIVKMIGCTEDDLKLLIAKGFVICFESGVIVITHWKMHNYIRSDRYRKTVFKNERSQLRLEGDVYSLSDLPPDSAVCLPCGIPSVDNLETQDRLGKDRLGKDSNTAHLHERFGRCWDVYPKKKGRQEALKAFKKIKPDDELLNAILEAVRQQGNTDQWQRDGGQFIPYPATWLNGRRWEDEPDKPVRPAGGKPDYSDPSRYEDVVEEMMHITEV